MTALLYKVRFKTPDLKPLTMRVGQIKLPKWAKCSCQTQMLGFKTFYNARRVLIGIELVQKILKGQFRVPAHFGQNFGSIWRNALAS
jgi:hypothetical protein